MDKITFRVKGSGIDIANSVYYYCPPEEEILVHNAHFDIAFYDSHNKPLNPRKARLRIEPVCFCDVFNFGCSCQRLTWENSNE